MTCFYEGSVHATGKQAKVDIDSDYLVYIPY